MIIRFRRTLYPADFARKHPKPHLIVGHYDPIDHLDEHGIGPVTYVAALGIAMNGLDLVGECSDLVDAETSTIRMMFEFGSDAARVCELVQAMPAKNEGECASQAEFTYDVRLYERLRRIQDARMETIRAAYIRGEDIEHVYGVLAPDENEPGPTADNWGGGHMRKAAAAPAR